MLDRMGSLVLGFYNMGRVDLFHSRRTNYYKCQYWIRDERAQTGSPSEWILYNQPSGSFYAKPVSVKSNQMNVINGVWAMDNNHITLETDDHVDEISRGCVIKYDDQLWLVESVQKEIHLKESEFSKHTDYKYTISLTRG